MYIEYWIVQKTWWRILNCTLLLHIIINIAHVIAECSNSNNNNGLFRYVKIRSHPKSVQGLECSCFKLFMLYMWYICSYFPPPVPGMVNQGPPFAQQPTLPSVAGVKLNVPSIATVTTSTLPMMPQQQVPPNQQQPVPPPGQPQQPQAPPQQQPPVNQPIVPSAQPNMVGRDNQDEQIITNSGFFNSLNV